MRNYLLLMILLQALYAVSLPAQVEVVRFFQPVFSPSSTTQATGERGVLRALVVGIDQYQHPGIDRRSHARRDAEAFAAFLKIPAGGSIHQRDLVLRTGEAATLAEITDALNWMVEESGFGDKIIIFLSIVGQLNPKNGTQLLFYDSAPAGAGYMSLAGLTEALGKASTQNKARVFLAIDLHPYKPRTEHLQRWNKSEQRQGMHTDKMVFPSGPPGKDSLPVGPFFGNNLLQGLMGLADADQNEALYVPELRDYLHWHTVETLTNVHCGYLAVSDPEDWLCKPASRAREKIIRQARAEGTPIIQMEVQPLDDFMDQHADAATLRLYEDFILAIRLGQLLSPPEHCAAALLDSLLQIPALQPVYRALQRRLAVGYQDEAQQAINAYLQTSAHELSRRRKDPHHYERYSEYIRRTQDILGKAHFMAGLLEIKQLYFEALELRLKFDQTSDSLLLPQALTKLRQALAVEPEAAFVYNEMGVVMALSGQPDTAIQYFKLALDRAPTWGIPLSNLSYILSKKGKFEQAQQAAIEAISLNAWNPNAYLVLGLIFLDNGDYENGGEMFRRALLLDPELPDAHYNMACVKAHQGKSGEALDALRLALRYGFDQPESFIRGDKDLSGLLGKPGFETLLGAHFRNK